MYIYAYNFQEYIIDSFKYSSMFVIVAKWKMTYNCVFKYNFRIYFTLIEVITRIY